MGSCVEGAIPLAVVGLNRRTNSFVMCGSSALGHGGTSATAMRCWHSAAPSITVPSIGYLNAIDSDFERRKNHRMLLFNSTCFTNNFQFFLNSSKITNNSSIVCSVAFNDIRRLPWIEGKRARTRYSVSRDVHG